VLRSDHWWAEPEYPSLSIAPRKNNSCIRINSIENNKCYFQANKTSRFIQNVDLNRYSTLIDNNRAWYNVSAYLGCSNTSRNDESIVELRFADHRNNHENNQIHSSYFLNICSYLISCLIGLKYGNSWELSSDSSFIPIGTRSVRIMIGMNIEKSSNDFFSCCAIDDVNLRIFEKQ
jgi:hypothetical protein